MKRDERLVQLSSEHHQALVLCLRIERKVDTATDDEVETLYSDALNLWRHGLIPHFGAEADCLLARLVRHVSPAHEGSVRLQADHLRVGAIMADLRDARSAGGKREALRDLGSTLRDHVRWEEATFFPLIEEQLTGEELDRIASELRERLPVDPPTAYGTDGVPRRPPSA